MRFKGTLGLLLVFAVLGGYVYFSDFYNQEEKQKQEEAKKRLFAMDVADIDELTLRFEGREVTARRKGEREWEITTPMGLDADSDVWEQLATSFAQVQKEEVISEQKTDLAQYGLDSPEIEVQSRLKDGTTPGVLIGVENPRMTSNYAKRLDEDQVFLVSTTAGAAFKKSLTDLRNKQVLPFEAQNIDSVRIAVTGKPELEMHNSGTAWQMTRPLETIADEGEISGFLSAIQFSRASAFAPDNVDLKGAGLDNPSVKVVLHDKQAGTDLVLLFGKSPETDKYYAKNESRPAIFILGTEILEKAKASLLDWRDKAIVRLGSEGTTGVEEIDLTRGSERQTFNKKDTDWITPDGKKAQSGKILELLGAIASERAIAIQDSPGELSRYGLASPRLEVVLKGKDSEMAVLQFGRESATPEGVYLKSNINPAILIVNKDLFNRLNQGPSDLLEAPAAPESPTK